MEDKEISELIQHTNRLYTWVSKKIFLQFNEAQYRALLKGYRISWDMRYGLHLLDDYFYIHRSGHVVGKFKLKKIENDLYQVTEMYDNPAIGDWNFVFDSLREACRQNEVELDITEWAMMRRKTFEMQEENQ